MRWFAGGGGGGGILVPHQHAANAAAAAAAAAAISTLTRAKGSQLGRSDWDEHLEWVTQRSLMIYDM